MARTLTDALADVRAALLDDATLVRAVASGRRQKQPRPRWRRVELRYVDLTSGRRLQVSEYDETQAHVRNVPTGPEAEQAVDTLLAEPFGNWHVDTLSETTQLRVTKKGDALLHRRRRDATAPPSRAHDRSKQRRLDPASPFLHLIGITDHRGVVKPSRQAKFRQVEEFLRDLDAALDDAATAGVLPAVGTDRPLRVIDLGCGNAYLTFAAFAYLDGVRDMSVDMVGVDVKAQSRRRNTDLAEQLGWDALRFVEGSIASAEVPFRPDVVLALHACDTATDEALARAVHWEAPLVLAAPCCHHDVQRQMRGRSGPAPYSLLTQHGILRERFADVLTDSLRAALLRRHGYRVDVVQFVESKHTPRNVLLRGVRTGAPMPDDAQRAYDDLLATWGVRPALARMLDG